MFHVAESKVSKAESEFKNEIQRLDEESSQLKLKQQSLQHFCTRLEHAQKNKKLASQFEKSTLKNILDRENKYENLAACLDASYLTVVKARLLKHEENNTFPWNSFGYYKPLQALRDCSLSVISELGLVNKRLAAIEQGKAQKEQAFERQKKESEQKEADMAAAEAAAQQSLNACLEDLLRNRKESFLLSDKGGYVKMLKGQLEQNLIDDAKARAKDLRSEISNPRHKKRWFEFWKSDNVRSVGIFDKYFDEQNQAKPLPPGSAVRKNSR